MPGYVYKGTRTGNAHQLYAETAAKYGRPKGRPKGLKPFDPAKCGTMPGWRQHRAHGQKECRDCMDAQNAYMQKYRDKKKVGH